MTFRFRELTLHSLPTLIAMYLSFFFLLPTFCEVKEIVHFKILISLPLVRNGKLCYLMTSRTLYDYRESLSVLENTYDF